MSEMGGNFIAICNDTDVENIIIIIIIVIINR